MNEDSIIQFVRQSYKPIKDEELGYKNDGAQMFREQWWVPTWGCDTLEHLIDGLEEEVLEPEISRLQKELDIITRERDCLKGWYDSFASVQDFMLQHSLWSDEDIDEGAPENTLINGLKRTLIKSLKKDVDKKDVNKKDDETISDDYGNEWSAYCMECGRKSMQIVRPGKVQCPYCG